MPIYEYRCDKCGDNFEVEQKMTDDPLTVHECGGNLSKVFSSVGIVWKGQGFYKTDARNKTETKTDKADPKPTKTETPKKAEKTAKKAE